MTITFAKSKLAMIIGFCISFEKDLKLVKVVYGKVKIKL
jgi:hypothetical protein